MICLFTLHLLDIRLVQPGQRVQTLRRILSFCVTRGLRVFHVSEVMTKTRQV
jgi:hypothetical protein